MKIARFAAVALFSAGLSLSGQVWAEARVLVVHAAPFAADIADTSVTVSVNGAPAITDFQYKDFTDYIPLPAGTYDLAVTPTGAEDPAITATVELESGVDYTVLAVGDGVNQGLALWPLVDNFDAPPADSLNLRVVHAAPFAADLEATEVSIRTAGGQVVAGLAGVPYFAQSGFFPVPAATYDLKVASVDGFTNFIDPLPVDLPAGLDVTVIAIGDGVNQPLGILALPVGELGLRDPVDASLAGHWTVTNTAAQDGLYVSPMPASNRLVGTITTFDPAGSGLPIWWVFDTCFTAPGDTDCPNPGGFDGRTAEAQVYAVTGAEFGGDTAADVVAAGTIGFDFADCGSGVAVLDVDGLDEVTWDLARLTITVPCTLED